MCISGEDGDVYRVRGKSWLAGGWCVVAMGGGVGEGGCVVTMGGGVGEGGCVVTMGGGVGVGRCAVTMGGGAGAGVLQRKVLYVLSIEETLKEIGRAHV